MTDLNTNLFTKELNLNPGYIIDPSQLQGIDVPAREWLVPGMIPLKTVTLLSGDGGLGKSLLMQQLMTATATGHEWLGMPVKPGKAFGLFCEDSNGELWRRQKSICNGLSIELSDCYNMQWLSGDGIDPILMEFNSDAGENTTLFNQLMDYWEHMEIEFIVIDTAADTFAGNEISRIQVRNFINRCLRFITSKLDATVILTSHPSRTGMSDGSGLSGSTAWNNSVRSRLYLTRPADEKNNNVRLLQIKKSNYGSTENEIRLVWENGIFQSVENTIGQNPLDRETNDEAAYLNALEKLHKRGQRALIHRNQATYGPKVMKSLEETKGVSQQRLEDAQDRLMNKEIIANIEDREGAKSKRKSHIQIINPDMAKEIMNLKLF